MPEPVVATILRWKWEKMKAIDLSQLALITNSTINELTNTEWLEKKLLPSLGLNNEALYQMPEELYPYTGAGLLHWQYPKQFSKYLVLLSQLKLESYLEIGVRHGGTFVITIEYLQRFHRLERAVGLDRGYSPSVVTYSKQNKTAQFFQADTQTERFADMLKKEAWFDCILIDGNHDEEACRNDYEAVKNKAGIIVLHDMASDSCAGVQKLWKQIKQGDDVVCFEFAAQYESVVARTGQHFFGLGVAIKKSVFRTKGHLS